uniref:NADH:ubiquinone reductase (H(+)-translocating) n=1 Tax=Pholcus phalangioides TaxID=6932 RepID=L7NVY5_PHOPA|nr:NADH dehydrogenase subunit 5 [Pholcus phalangioides]AFC77889.1 NADH dehydrogenase subunit 5 [Pholcus phalangioides]
MNTMILIASLIISMSLFLYSQNIFMSLSLSFCTPYPMSLEMSLSWQSSLFMSTVLLISFMIMKYSKEYIPPKNMKMFMIVLSLFVASMLLLITSNNILFLIMGWDGLGLTSYILVIFYQNSTSNNAGTLTILTNRVGDIMIIMSVSTLSFSGLWNTMMNKSFPTMVLIMLLVASMTKSAQFPFTAWLPAAMAAPTPVSALVHSSTLVTAGIILMVRISDNIHTTIMKPLLMMSLLTSITASLSAMWEMDLKKIIALSTLSQVAFMMTAISLNMPLLAMFHLITHALFKATMFMCVGQLIHSSSYQDSRSIKSSLPNSPLTLSCLGITSMALSGLPFMSGFYSKDAIIETLCPQSLSYPLMTMMIISITLTTIYNLRITMNSVSLISSKTPDNDMTQMKDMELSLTVMTPLSLVAGSIMSWMMNPCSTLTMSLSQKITPIMTMLLAWTVSNLTPYLNINTNSMSMIPSTMWMMNSTSTLPKMTLIPGSTLINMDNSWKENSSLILTNSMKMYALPLSKTPSLLLIMFTILLPMTMYPNS